MREGMTWPGGGQRLRPSKPLTTNHISSEDFTVYRPAGFVLRWYALTLDLAFFAPIDVMIHLPFSRYLERLSAYGYDVKFYSLSALLAAIPLLLYFIAPTLIWGQTLGKSVVGIRVIGSNFRPSLGLSQILWRETIGKAVSLAGFGVGFFMAAWTPRKRGMHDYLAKTQVICYRQR